MLNYLVWPIFDKEGGGGVQRTHIKSSIKHKLNVSLTMLINELWWSMLPPNHFSYQCGQKDIQRKLIHKLYATPNHCSVSLSYCIVLMCYIKETQNMQCLKRGSKLIVTWNIIFFFVCRLLFYKSPHSTLHLFHVGCRL